MIEELISILKYILWGLGIWKGYELYKFVCALYKAIKEKRINLEEKK